MKSNRSVIIINVNEYFKNSIENGLNELIEDGFISFPDENKKEEFVSDLLSELIEQFEIDTSYYDDYCMPNNKDIKDAVSDKIELDKDYYDISVLDE